jgi:hypothetical protein
MAMRPKRSNDPVQAAHQLYMEIIGEAEPQPLPENDPATVAKRKGASKGGERLAAKLSPEERAEKARKAAAARWKKP